MNSFPLQSDLLAQFQTQTFCPKQCSPDTFGRWVYLLDSDQKHKESINIQFAQHEEDEKERVSAVTKVQIKARLSR